ncbi:MAG TPA: amino acid ABC transporter ATP-binding protein [Thermomicrobiales bacterium]|nr:amino acid ABC transporter ATP-binding protein [Thermomicrobiales bacterium]
MTVNTAPAAPIVVATGVRKHYGRLEVLRGVSMTVNRGEVKVVVGPSGSGKSTFLRCLGLLEQIDDGRIVLDAAEVSWLSHGDRRPRERDLARHRSEICMVFQHFNLFPHMTAVENVMVGPVHVRGTPKNRAREEALALLDRVRLAERANHYPHELSGGQQQRVAIARALAMRPKVMLFDEPTSALDAELVREVIDVMEELVRDGMTMIVVSHELRFAHEAADTIVMMADGEIIEEAPPGEFFTAPRHERTRQFLSIVE